MAWTIVANGAEVSLDRFRIAAMQRRRSSQALDVVGFVLDGASFDEDLPLAAEASVVIKRDGQEWFSGRVTGAQRTATGSVEGIRYEVSGPWWYLEQLVFQQTWHIFGGGDVHKSHCLLNQFADGSAMGVREQIAEALDWAITQATAAFGSAPFQYTKADLPDLYLPVDEVRDITCAEVVRKQLRWVPDAVAWFDYSTSPPTFRCSRRVDLAVMDVAATGLGAVTLVPRFDLVVPAVVLKYERIDTVNGSSVPTVFTDAAPTTATGAEFGALCSTIDLQGFAISAASAQITTATLPAAGDSAGWWEWLKTKEGWLSGSAPELVEFVSVSRAADDPDAALLPRELIEGQVADWMTFTTQQETVKIRARINVRDSGGELADTVAKDFSVNIITTTATTGTYKSSAITASGESPPVGLAQALYTGLSVLEYDGSITLVSEEVGAASVPSIGHRVNLTGSRAEWQAMEAVVQEVTEDVDLGTTTLRVGPPQHLGPRDIVELLRVNRFRFVYTASSARAGTSTSSGSVGLGRTTPKENASSGSNLREFLRIASGGGSITLNAALCGNLDVTVREISICVNGVEKRMLVLASEPY